MLLTDTHSHLYDTAFDDDRRQAMNRAMVAGVDRLFLPAIDSESHEALFDLCRAYPDRCFPMMGLHPTSVNDQPDYEAELTLVERYLKQPPEGITRFCAIGEVGLDFYWSREHVAEQIDAFERQIEWSLQYRLPLVIHTRAAEEQMVALLRKYRGSGLRGVMHAFTGSYADYRAIRECGEFVFGIGGVVTYKNSGLADLLTRMSPADLVLETDCPYLTPVPFRGKRNESAYLRYTCLRMAELLGMPEAEVARITTENSRRIFGI